MGEAAGATFCAVAMFAAKESAANAIRNCFIMIFTKWIFQSGNWLWRTRITRSRVNNGASAQKAFRDSGEVNWTLAFPENAAHLRA